MFKSDNLKSFIMSRVFGLFSLIIAIFLFLNLISFNESDATFGNLTSSLTALNYLGTYGAHISGFFLATLHYSSYLIPVFFLIIGIKSIFGIKYKNFFTRVVSLLIGVCVLNLSLTLANIDAGIIGKIFFAVTKNFFFNFQHNVFFKWTTLGFIFLLSVLFISYGLTFRVVFVFSLSKKILNLVSYFFKLFKFVKIPIPSLPQEKKERGRVIVKKITKLRKEPTIEKHNFSDDGIQKIYKSSQIKFDNNYGLPPLTLLKTTNEKKLNYREADKTNIEYSKKLEIILKEYGVEGSISSFKSGPVVTLFEFVPAPGIKTSKVVGLSEDIARAMSSVSTRISSQPGKSTIGIEIPNIARQNVFLGDLIKDSDFMDSGKKLTLALGKNISGEKKYTDLERMPHLLIAGTTGSGKSVGINAMIMSLLYKFKPSECKLILIDPKMLELSIYENIPHLLSPVVTDPQKAVFALKWVVGEMENRYRLMTSTNVKNIQSFNYKIKSTLAQGKKLYREVQTGIDSETKKPIIEKREIPLEKMPLIVVVVDEMADLMMIAGKEVENLIQRLAQMARASGIHLIAATQRPSVDVITGTIKANFPSRISFRVASRFDSRTILNEMGAEQLLGNGDMLFLENGANLVRLHGGYISENEIESVVECIKSQSANETQVDITNELISDSKNDLGFDLQSKNTDELYSKAVSIVINQQKVSTSYIQRYLQIGYNRAARIVEQMEEEGIISEASHAGKRSVLKK
jgi:S-DNA-T family DNA segregation ATPase FtsK/SpoIIIE